MLYNHGEQSVITPPPVSIFSFPPPPPSLFVLLFSLLPLLLRSAIPSTERSLPRSPPRSQISKSESLPPSLSLFQSSSPSNFSASLLRCSAVASSVEARPSVTRITRIASKTANNKCFSAPRNRRKIRAAVISPRRFPRNGAAAVSRKIVCARFSFIYSRRRRRKKEKKRKERSFFCSPSSRSSFGIRLTEGIGDVPGDRNEN